MRYVLLHITHYSCWPSSECYLIPGPADDAGDIRDTAEAWIEQTNEESQKSGRGMHYCAREHAVSAIEIIVENGILELRDYRNICMADDEEDDLDRVDESDE